MNLPFTLNFFKKFELFQTLRRLDAIARAQRGGKMENTWKYEKRILRWTYQGHKHLGSNIHKGNLDPADGENRLAEMLIDPRKFDADNIMYTFENLVSRGYATWQADSKTPRKERFLPGVIISKEGLLMGEVIWETTKEKKFELKKNKHFVSYWLLIWIFWFVIAGGLLLLFIDVISRVGLVDEFARSLAYVRLDFIFSKAAEFLGFIVIIAIIAITVLLALTLKGRKPRYMKTILVDAINAFVIKGEGVFEDMHKLLDEYPNHKIILTGANDEQFKEFGLDKMPYEVFTLKHDPEKADPAYYKKMLDRYHMRAEDVIYFEHNVDAVKNAESVGIKTHYYDKDKRDLTALKKFIESNI
jgi:hypothetical protein